MTKSGKKKWHFSIIITSNKRRTEKKVKMIYFVVFFAELDLDNSARISRGKDHVSMIGGETCFLCLFFYVCMLVGFLFFNP